MFLHKLNLFLNIYFLRGAPQLKFPIFHACLLNQNCQFSLKYFNQFFTEKQGAGLKIGRDENVSPETSTTDIFELFYWSTSTTEVFNWSTFPLSLH